MKDTFDEFFDDEGSNNEPENEATEVEAEEAEAETETEDEAQAEETVEEQPEAQPEKPNMVPVSALTAERSKAKDRQDEIDRLNAELARYRQQPEQQPQQQSLAQQGIPDPYDNPSEYHNFVMAQARQQFQLENLNHSRVRAIQKYGQEAINEAADWAGEQARSNPNFEAELLSQPDPAEWVIEQRKRSVEFTDFNADPDAYVRKRAAELGLAPVAAAAEAIISNPARKAPTPSIVHAKSRDVAQPINPEDTFDAVFRKK